MFGLQPWHLIVIVIVALVIFGPSRLPEIGRGLGKALNEFRKGTKEMTEGFRDEVTRPNVDQPVSPAMPAAQMTAPQSQPAAEGGNFCVQCGAQNPVGARFCNKCGAQLPV